MASNCRHPLVQDEGTYRVLDAGVGREEEGGVCGAVSGARVEGGAYDASVELYNVMGRGGAGVGAPGLIYNVHDSLNFDFVVFR